MNIQFGPNLHWSLDIRIFNMNFLLGIYEWIYRKKKHKNQNVMLAFILICFGCIIIKMFVKSIRGLSGPQKQRTNVNGCDAKRISQTLSTLFSVTWNPLRYKDDEKLRHVCIAKEFCFYERIRFYVFELSNVKNVKMQNCRILKSKKMIA